MGRKIKVRLDWTLKAQTGTMLPQMVERLMAYRDDVARHPESEKELHEMRIAGRPLRYVMEAVEPAFGPKFHACLEEVKHILDAAGQVHDYDVLIDLLQRKERALNLRETTLRKLLGYHRKRRMKKFKKLADMLMSWGGRKFKKKLLLSITE